MRRRFDASAAQAARCSAAPSSTRRRHPGGGSRGLPAHGRPRGGAAARGGPRAHPLQCGSPRHRRLRHGSRVIRSEARHSKVKGRLRRRDAAHGCRGHAMHRWETHAPGRHHPRRSSPNAPGRRTSWPARDHTCVVVGAEPHRGERGRRQQDRTYNGPSIPRSTSVAFCVAAPVSTFDLATPTGEGHPDRGAPSER